MHRLMLSTMASSTLLLALTAFSAAQPPSKINPDTAALAQGNNAFAFNLYANLKTTDGNLFFSPYSISNALAMTYAGARGKTATDMAAALQFPFRDDKLHVAYSDLMREINQPGKQRMYKLAIANRLWGQKNYGFLPSFLTLSKAAYGASLEELDFVNQTEAARKTINDWVAKETQDKIKDLLPAGSIRASTRLVLSNAIYFKANWATPFNAKATKQENFKLDAAKTVQADMMHGGGPLSLFENETMQLVELPYLMNELSMLILLPRKLDGLAKLEKDLKATNVQQWAKAMKPHEVKLSLPKFKYTSGSIELSDELAKMGMGIAFTGDADFSGMASGEKLSISKVIHKGFVAVDEKGTEAAAATAVAVDSAAMPGELPVATFAADHPFLFLIRDNRTGSVLFIGRVMNPPS